MIFRFLDFELDAELFELRRGDAVERLAAERKVIDLLLFMVRNRDRVVSREDLLAAVWPDVVVRERVVDQAIYSARKVLEDDASAPRVLETVRGRGWRFVAEVLESALRRWPSRDLPPGEIPFVGRQKELAALEGALEAGTNGHGSLVLVSGEPGIGKSRLLDEFAARANRLGVRPYLGNCPEVDGAPPFWPWTQLLRAHRIAVGERAWDAVIDRTPQIGQLSPSLDEQERWRTRAGPTHMGNDQFLLYDTIVRFWHEVADDLPVLLLLLDDLHRADQSSYQLLRYMAPELRGARVVVVGTSRRVESGLGLGTHLALSPLSKAEISTFVNLSGHPSETLDLTNTTGNPLLLRTVLIGDHGRSAGPVSLHAAVMRFTAALPRATAAVLAAASVHGRAFSMLLLADALQTTVRSVSMALDPALATGAIRRAEPYEYSFAHVLLREAIYEALPASVASQHHSAIARSLIELGGDTEVIAHHLRSSRESADLPLAFDYSLRAGRDALARLAPDKALAHLQAAERLAGFVETTQDSLEELDLALGEAEIRSGLRSSGTQRLRSAGRSARARKLATRLAETALATTPGALAIDTGVVDSDAIASLESALTVDQQLPTDIRVRLRSRLAMALHALPEEAGRRKRLVSEARELAESRSSASEVLVAEAVSCWGPDGIRDRRDTIRVAIGCAQDAEELELEAIARILAVGVEHSAGDGAATRQEMDSLAELVKNKGVRTLSWYPLLYQATCAVEIGDLAAGERLLTEMLKDAGAGGGANAANAFGGGMFAIKWHSGEFESARELAREGTKRFPRILIWQCAEGLSASRLGNEEEARAILNQVLRRAINTREKDLLWLGTVATLGDLCADVGHATQSAELLSRVEPYAGRFVSVGYGVLSWGAIDRVLGRLYCAIGRVPKGGRSVRPALTRFLRAPERRSGCPTTA